ncbi:Sorting nexin mvp1, partial [Mortierella hygrophila]
MPARINHFFLSFHKQHCRRPQEPHQDQKGSLFDDVAAAELTLWHVSIPDDDDDHQPVLLDKEVSEKKQLKATTKLFKVFGTVVPEDMIHMIFQCPPPSDLHTNIKKITDKFFVPGSDVAKFLDAFTKGQGALPTTTGSILGCGKTRAVIGLLSQHWRFYFNAADDDWRSGEMTTLYNTVRSYLQEVQANSAINNLFARETTLLLFLIRLLIFKYCLIVPDSSETFTSARWALLQVCPHVLFKDFFNPLLLRLLQLRHHRELDLSDFVRNVHEDAKDRLVKHGYLPKINDNTRLLVINDGAQFLGDQLNGPFQSMSYSEDSSRPLLSPIRVETVSSSVTLNIKSPGALSTYLADEVFLERRLRGLTRFMNALMRHPVLKNDPLVISFLTEPVELALWRKNVVISTEDEFTTKLPISESLVKQVPMDLELQLESIKRRLPASVEYYRSMVHVMDRVQKRTEANAVDYMRFSLALNALADCEKHCHVEECYSCGQLSQGYGKVGSHMGQASNALEEQARATQ